jgi:hypothetical protein
VETHGLFVTQLSGGTQQFAIGKRDGIQFRTPAGWEAVEPLPNEAARIKKEVGKQLPTNCSFFGTVEPAYKGLPPDQILERFHHPKILKTQMEADPAAAPRLLEFQKRSVAGHPAYRSVWSFEHVENGVRVPLKGIVLGVAYEGAAFSSFCTCAEADFSALAAEFDSIQGSVRLSADRE